VSDLFGIGAGVQGLITRVHGRKSRKHAEHMRRTDWEHNYIADAVADAKAAGIHPLYALGSSPGGGSPMMLDYGESEAAAIGAAVSQAVDGFSKREDRDLQSRYTQAQIGVLESEKARNEAQTAETLSAIARAAQPSSPRGVIAPRGQVGTPGVDGPANQIERFGTPLGYVDANKRFADSEEVERRWGDVAQELYGTGLFIHELSTNLARSYNQFMDSVINPPTRIRTMQDWDNFFEEV